MLRNVCSEYLCHELLQSGVNTSHGVDLTDGKMRRGLLRAENMHLAAGLLPDEYDRPEQELPVRSQSWDDGVVPWLGSGSGQSSVILSAPVYQRNHVTSAQRKVCQVSNPLGLE